MWWEKRIVFEEFKSEDDGEILAYIIFNEPCTLGGSLRDDTRNSPRFLWTYQIYFSAKAHVASPFGHRGSTPSVYLRKRFFASYREVSYFDCINSWHSFDSSLDSFVWFLEAKIILKYNIQGTTSKINILLIREREENMRHILLFSN